MTKIRTAAVIGSGVMGSGIAAHLANVGIPVLLLDMVPAQLLPQEESAGLTLEHPKVRNRLAVNAMDKLKRRTQHPYTVRPSSIELPRGIWKMIWQSSAMWIGSLK